MKRFTETEKWTDRWFRKLQPAEKLLWLYILDICDNAGFFELDVEMASFITGMKEEHILGANKGLKRGLLGADKNEHLFYVKNFLRHQGNLPLNPENNAHRKIIRILEERKREFLKEETFFRGLLAPLYSRGSSRGIGSGKKKTGRGKEDYSLDFEEWWKAYGFKGVKSDAYKRWNECKCLPDLEKLISSTKAYIAHCKATERTQRDGAGYISGKLWESSWEIPAVKPASAKDLGGMM